MAIGVKGAQNRVNVLGFDVSTTDHTLTGVVSRADVVNSGFNYIFKIRAVITGGDAELFPLGRAKKTGPPSDAVNLTDDVAANAAAAQAEIQVTNIDRFSVGDYIYIQDDTYTNFEWGRVITVATGTSIITLSANLTNTYNTVDNAEVGVIGNLNSRIPVSTGFTLNEAGLNFPSLYVRKLQAADVTVKGYVVMI